MTQQLNRQLVEAFVVGRTAMVLAEDVVFADQAQSRSFTGRAAVEAIWQALFVDGFAEVRIEIRTLIADDTAAALEFIFCGRHHGRFMGLPPTGQDVAIPMALFCQIEAGQIRRATLFYDAGTLLRQLGLAL
ncbi:MAG TPA: ester cyclase [Roseiflexaceae bacterium]|nr:ester cyclase [Roseiflexaceae bacterium]